MADLKISQLSSATALAGTEVVPVVQSGATKKATIDQILAPASGKGINFAAAGGDTLTIYDEGTWTPADGSGAGLSFTVSDNKYTRVGRLVHCSALVTFPTTASGLNAQITGLPFVCGNYALGQLVGFFGVSGCVTAAATLSELYLRDLTGTSLTNVALSTKIVAISIVYQV